MRTTPEQRAEWARMADPHKGCDLLAIAEADRLRIAALERAVPALLADLEEAHTKITRLRQGLWDCFAAAGGDIDGDPTPVALVSDIVPLALDCVRGLRAELDESEAENATLRQQLAASDAALIESRANDCEAMRQLAEAKARIAELSAMLDHKADEADEAEVLLRRKIAGLEFAQVDLLLDLFAGKARIAQLERVQGVLVESLAAAELFLRLLGRTLYADRCRAAIAEAKKGQ